MPLYEFENQTDGKREEHFVKIADVEQFLTDNPHLTKCLSTPAFGDSVRIFGNRDQGFKEVLQKTKEAHPHGEWSRISNNV